LGAPVLVNKEPSLYAARTNVFEWLIEGLQVLDAVLHNGGRPLVHLLGLVLVGHQRLLDDAFDLLLDLLVVERVLRKIAEKELYGIRAKNDRKTV
jgi:hypothetical protein